MSCMHKALSLFSSIASKYASKITQCLEHIRHLLNYWGHYLMCKFLEKPNFPYPGLELLWVWGCLKSLAPAVPSDQCTLPSLILWPISAYPSRLNLSVSCLGPSEDTLCSPPPELLPVRIQMFLSPWTLCLLRAPWAARHSSKSSSLECAGTWHGMHKNAYLKMSVLVCFLLIKKKILPPGRFFLRGIFCIVREAGKSKVKGHRLLSTLMLVRTLLSPRTVQGVTQLIKKRSQKAHFRTKPLLR